ncbi:NAD(P)-binding protein [Vibrio cholerae]|uniref:protoporphyrinogen/coproporphyrinogen oxidase n=1 Tax=Vibrio cholerae TaxID=666 RepID=UPI0011D49B00|nr:NAD(P)-binding protein [Vibrio cholerae]TXZ21379.1 NAD(P)-binding protein [Vibrio cholerae]BCN21721.1 hypothetical protein [Vibrio cholerae]GIA49591.1 flavin-containing amine oxidase [Vibrio cholerae]
MNNKKTKYLILGSGISGIYASLILKDEDYCVIERENVPGGYCRTIKKDGYIWDYAGHFFHFADKEIKSFFESKIDSSKLIYKEKNTKIRYKDLYIDYPFQKNIHQLDKDEFIDCLYELYNKESMDFYSSFETMLYGKFGRAITDKFLRPYNEKLYSCDLNELDVDAMGRFFPYTDLDSVIKNMKHKTDDSYNNTFLYPKDGAEVFINALFSEVDSNKYFFNQDILSVNLKNKIVKTTQGSFYYEYLINTIPFDKFLSLTEDYSYSKKDAESLTSNKVLVFNLGFNKKSKLTNEHWVYIPSKNINFYRIGFYDNILNSDKLSMYVEIGYQSAIETKDIDIENELELTITNLKKLDIIDDHTLVSYESIIMDPAYVHISKDSNKFKAKCFSDLIEQDVYMVGRYGQWKYCSIEDSMLDARNAIKMIKDKQV